MTLHNQVNIGSMDLQLLPERAALEWSGKALYLADLHLGKDGLWRSNGQYAPEVTKIDLERLNTLLDNYQIDEVYFLGDLIHSRANNDFNYLANFLNNRDEKFYLIAGNHDRWAIDELSKYPLIITDTHTINGVELVHDLDQRTTDLPAMVGHVHPSIKIPEVGKLPAFIFKDDVLTLPAFGSFNGSMRVKTNFEGKSWVVADGEVVMV